jgi:transposase
MSQREAARHFGISRDSVRKMLAFSVPPGYRRTARVRRPKLDGFTNIIDGWLALDRGVPRKQRHTAKRVFERLRDEHGFGGGYTIVKDYIRERERRGREMFVPLAHPPGHAQADFGEAVVVIDGVEQKSHFFVMDLPHSDACFVRAYPAATAEAWMDGHVHAFTFFGGVPASILYDNDRCLMSKILPDGTRQRATLFSALQSHYLFRDRYGRPGKGNDKGSVEGLVGYSRRNFMVPIPRFATWDDFNAYLEERCRARQADVLRGHKETIGDRLGPDLTVMGALPAAPFEACDRTSGRVSSQSPCNAAGAGQHAVHDAARRSRTSSGISSPVFFITIGSRRNHALSLLIVKSWWQTASSTEERNTASRNSFTRFSMKLSSCPTTWFRAISSTCHIVRSSTLRSRRVRCFAISFTLHSENKVISRCRQGCLRGIVATTFGG